MSNEDRIKVTRGGRTGRQSLIGLLLIVATLIAYWKVFGNEFMNYDDNLYVTENSWVQAGFTSKSVAWAFTTWHTANWHPLTWLSLMLDSEVYGLRAWGFHLTNLLLHIANTVLLFFIFRRMTGAIWQSAFVAAVFALHPLHIESVGWAAERKDVLCALFWMLTMWAYVRYVDRPRLARYSLAVLFFALGLMAKPMLVTLPFVLLLLDYWPLRRFAKQRASKPTKGEAAVVSSPSFRWKSFVPLVREKIPFFALAIASSVVTFLAQQRGESVLTVDQLALSPRVMNSIVAYVLYIVKTVWPTGLAVFYPHPGAGLPVSNAILAGFALLVVSALVLRAFRNKPYLTVGWLWYLGTLVPVIGLVQVGGQSMADRYTYVPMIGLSIMVAWGATELATRWKTRQEVVTAGALLVVAALLIGTMNQLSYWKNSITLFEHTLAVTTNNAMAHDNLGSSLYHERRLEEALAHYREALRISPNYWNAQYNIGTTLHVQGKLSEAVDHYSQALRLRPQSEKTHYNLGTALHGLGKVEDAVVQYKEALRLKPDYAEAHNNLGAAFQTQGKYDEAIEHFRLAIQIRGDYAEAKNNLAKTIQLQQSSQLSPQPIKP